MLKQNAADGRATAIAGGGSDLVGLVKEHLVAPGVLINLKTIPSLDRVTSNAGGVTIGVLITLDALSRQPLSRSRYAVLAQAGESVATPQIRNGATLAGNVCQRPWCWCFRNGFPRPKNGGTTCYSVSGEHQFMPSSAGG